jgi:hypothetical protein
VWGRIAGGLAEGVSWGLAEVSKARREMQECWGMGGRGLALLSLLALNQKHLGSEWVQFIIIRRLVNGHAGGFAIAFRHALLNTTGGGKAAAGAFADSHLAVLVWAAR